jgi:hypothetical protein
MSVTSLPMLAALVTRVPLEALDEGTKAPSTSRQLYAWCV